MARWKLTEPHYLTVPGTYWEQVLTDRLTQRPVRKQYPVPLHVDPRLSDDWNYKDPDNPMDGWVIVTNKKDPAFPKDILIDQEPTPGMLPLDDEAKEISAKYTWTPNDRVLDNFNMDMNSNSAKILDGLTKQLADAIVAGQAAPPSVAMTQFMEGMAVMMQQQTKLLEALVANAAKAPVQTDGRRA